MKHATPGASSHATAECSAFIDLITGLPQQEVLQYQHSCMNKFHNQQLRD